MFSGSSPTQPSFFVGRIPVTVSPLHLLLMAFLFYQMLARSVMLGVGAILIASFSVLCHELGHAWVSRRFGLGAAIELTGLGGLTSHMPARNNRELFLITAAGPAMNFALAAAFFAAGFVAAGLLAELVQVGMWINIVWGIYNLLPIIPLDGGILALVVLRRLFRKGDRAERIAHWAGVVLGGLGAMYGLATQSLLVGFVLGMAAFENWRALQALGPAPVRHERQRHPVVRDHLQAARDAYGRGDFVEAARLCHLARSEPFVALDEMRQLWQILALCAARQSHWDEAIRHAERLPDAPEMAQVRAVALLALGDAQRARAFLSQPAARHASEVQFESLRQLARRPSGEVAR